MLPSSFGREDGELGGASQVDQPRASLYLNQVLDQYLRSHPQVLVDRTLCLWCLRLLIPPFFLTSLFFHVHILQLSMYHCMTYNKYNQTLVSIHTGFLALIHVRNYCLIVFIVSYRDICSVMQKSRSLVLIYNFRAARDQ